MLLQGVSSARSSPPPYNAPDLGQLLNESEPQQFYDVTFKLGGNGTSACLCGVCGVRGVYLCVHPLAMAIAATITFTVKT